MTRTVCVYHDTDEWYGAISSCKICGGVSIWDGFNYCPDCGREIDWSNSLTEEDIERIKKEHNKNKYGCADCGHKQHSMYIKCEHCGGNRVILIEDFEKMMSKKWEENKWKTVEEIIYERVFETSERNGD